MFQGIGIYGKNSCWYFSIYLYILFLFLPTRLLHTFIFYIIALPIFFGGFCMNHAIIVLAIDA
ncbi:hypothetical protein A3G63_00230 [Candidatus Kaiserbacteria bacterium RIFCSPLOWO2_12_FULL_52_8]|nr:MAG: hypothetical protein A3G63_00230 [Candidatus Kaiserbacteria bacterium RIFCSPLOWO2_12_FULL_52_8]